MCAMRSGASFSALTKRAPTQRQLLLSSRDVLAKGSPRQGCTPQRQNHSVPSPSSSTESPSSTAPLRSRRATRERDSKGYRGDVDLVGPPDPVSNIRPVVYAQPESSTRRRDAQDTKDHQVNSDNPHPYSANEFSQPGSRTERQGHARGLGIFRIYRDHVDYVTDRVEEADMRLRLAKTSTDSTTQRFWRDNNVRFSRDLESWRRAKGYDESAGAKQILGPAPIDSTSAADTLPAKKSEPTSESDFYATWLQANAKRNRSYNVLVWKQAWEQVRLGARTSLLRTWLKIIRRLEGRGPDYI